MRSSTLVSLPGLLALTLLVACGGAEPMGFQGYVEGEYVRVAASLGGRLESLDVRRGVRVQARTRLFTLEQDKERVARDEAEQRLRGADAQLEDLKKGQRPTELAALEAQLDQARAARTLSASQLHRQQALAKQQYVSKDTLDALRSASERDVARVAELTAQLATAHLGARRDEIDAALAAREAARAVLAQAEWDLSQKTVTAAAAGLVTDYFYNAGEWVPAGIPVVEILPPVNVKVRFFVPEPVLGTLRIGQPIRVICDGCPGALNGQVAYIAPQSEYTPPVIYSMASRQKLVYLVEARFSPEVAIQLHPGQPVSVTLP